MEVKVPGEEPEGPGLGAVAEARGVQAVAGVQDWAEALALQVAAVEAGVHGVQVVLVEG